MWMRRGRRFPRSPAPAACGQPAAAGPAGLAASLLAGLSAPLWDSGQLNASLQRNAARRDRLTANYRASLLTALKEGEDALDGLARQQSRDARAGAALTAAEQSYPRWRKDRLRAGALDGLSLLNAQRTLIASRDSRAQSRFDSLQAGIALYKALGGGWTKPSTEPCAPSCDTPVLRAAQQTQRSDHRRQYKSYGKVGQRRAGRVA